MIVFYFLFFVARLAPAERPFHDFAPLKEYPFCPLLVFSVATSNFYQCFLGLDKIVENFELEVVQGNLEQSHWGAYKLLVVTHFR